MFILNLHNNNVKRLGNEFNVVRHGGSMPGKKKNLPVAILHGTYTRTQAGIEIVFTYRALNQVGMRYIQHYYEDKSTTPQYKTFILDHPNNLAYVLRVLPEDGIYGFIIRNDKCDHKTPVVLRKSGNQIVVIVLDSLGTELNKGGLKLLKEDIEYAICRGYGEAVNISYTDVDFQRQSDSYSCGSEAHIVLKEALKLGIELFKCYEKQDEVVALTMNTPKFKRTSTDVPVQIVKYTQGLKRIASEFDDDKNVKGGKFSGKLDSKLLIVNSTKRRGENSSETLRQYFSLHRANGTSKWNSALDERRVKHLKLVEQYETTYTENDLREMQLHASGLDLILQADGANFADLYEFPNDFTDILMKIHYLCIVTTNLGTLECWNFDFLAAQETFDRMMHDLENSYQDALAAFIEGRSDSDTFAEIVKYRVLQHIFTEKFAERCEARQKNFVGGLFRQGAVVSAPASYRGEPPVVGDALLLPEIPMVTASTRVTPGMKNS